MNLLFKYLLIVLLSCTVSNAADIPDAPKVYPKGELGRVVKLGEDIMMQTGKHPLTKNFVKNGLQCKSCHPVGSDGKPGTTKMIGTLIGTATSFPAYSKREGTIQTLQNRINNCFMRSMNGTRPIIDSEASIAMTAYVTWLSTGLPIKMNAKNPVNPYFSDSWVANQKKFKKIMIKSTHKNYLRGKDLFKNQCAACHGLDGKGIGVFPALWGQNERGDWLAYNAGAGLASLTKLAVWLQANMPHGNRGTLNSDDAADMSLYINAQPRANFDLQKSFSSKMEAKYYNSKVEGEKRSVRSNFETMQLDIDKIRGDTVIK